MKNKLLAVLLSLSVMCGVYGCSTADTVNHNLSKEANEFNVYRRITVTNARTDTIMCRQKDICLFQIMQVMNWLLL